MIGGERALAVSYDLFKMLGDSVLYRSSHAAVHGDTEISSTSKRSHTRLRVALKSMDIRTQPTKCPRELFYWEEGVATSGVEEMEKVARMLGKLLTNIQTYFVSYITNAFSEGINSKIQAKARGFRSFKKYRTQILFFCGKLSLAP